MLPPATVTDGEYSALVTYPTYLFAIGEYSVVCDIYATCCVMCVT
jgi:hypothetical protein